MFFDSQIEISRKLIKACSDILREEKKLILFPVTAFLAVCTVIATFIWPLLITGSFTNPELNVLGFREYVYLFLYYMIANTITIFFNTALIAEVHKKMIREKTGLTDGLKEALHHFRSILVFAFISSFLAMLLNYISRKTGLLGKIFSVAVDISWKMITFLAIPVMVIEEKDIFSSVKKSSELMKAKWGEWLASNIFFGTSILTAFLISLLILIPLIVIFTVTKLIALAVVLGIIVFALLLIFSFVVITLESIYQLVLYRYTADGVVISAFEEEYFKNAFTPNPPKRKGRK